MSRDRLTLTSPPCDALDITSFHGKETLGRLFQYDLELFSDGEEIEITDILGQTITVHYEVEGGETRHFNGIVSAFSQTEQLHDGGATYHATLRPWTWFLTRTADCRIFQDMSVPDIIMQVCDDQGFSDIRQELNEEHEAWVYCVQYRETDFNFISRLMEEEGIYYYFAHEDGVHTLVLSDSYSAHEPIRDEAVMFFRTSEADVGHGSCVSSWLPRQEVQPGAYVLNDFDFTAPKANLRTTPATVPKDYTGSEYEIYDYPGDYGDRFLGGSGGYEQLRIQELQVQQDQADGVTNLRVMATGGLFTLDGRDNNSQNKEYLVIDASYEITPNAENETEYQCQFSVIDAQVPFRPARATRKPVVQGPQTAVVVGPAGEEIHTDKFGRVKVQFHWDREGQDEDRKDGSSCWVRVSQIWAGSDWGAQFLPRIGHEVIVEFLEGDPDKPIITGAVYNDDNMPPYDLPDNKTQSGIKSDSSKGGGNANEIRFEDLAGSEEFYVHASKDLTVKVDNLEARTVYGNRTTEVKKDDTITIGGDRKEEITGMEDRTVTGDVVVLFQANESRQVIGNLEENIIGNEDRILGANQSTTITGDQTTTITGNQTTTVISSQTNTVMASQEETIMGPSTINYMAGATLFTPAVYKLTAVGGFDLTAPSAFIEFKGMSNSVTGMANGVTGTKIEACPMAHAVKGYDGDTVVTKIESAVTSIGNGAISIASKALSIFA
ncbi:VgrG protein [hydrothermal vent metagenome]|uniref:VgrG protein n=1 Tax=hydrothermal vent metagenome TaxID=652676 RepID=A0A3B0Y767_9ZZZZ